KMAEDQPLGLVFLRLLHPATVESDLADHRRLFDQSVDILQPLSPTMRLPGMDAERRDHMWRLDRDALRHLVRSGIHRDGESEDRSPLDVPESRGESVAVAVQV